MVKPQRDLIKPCDVGSARIRPPGGLDVGSRETVVVSRSFLCRWRGLEFDSMKAFEFDGGAPAEFVGRVQSVLAERGLADHVNLHHEGGELVVTFRWMGRSELRYRILQTEGGFKAEPSGESISPFHSPFRQQFEDRFEKVVGAVGARVV